MQKFWDMSRMRAALDGNAPANQAASNGLAIAIERSVFCLANMCLVGAPFGYD